MVLTPEQIAALVSIPAAIAVIVMAGLFLKHISEQRKEDRIALAGQRNLDRVVWENHLSQSIAVQSKTAEMLGDLVASIKIMQSENAHGMVWARDAMTELIREIGRSSPAKP